jgi:hypothetical protein
VHGNRLRSPVSACGASNGDIRIQHPANWLRGGDCGARALPRDLPRRRSGISFWLPGLYGSLSATPAIPGWSVATIYYHTSVDASGAAAAAREFQVGRFSPNVNINLNVALSGQADLQFIAPTYTFAEPVLGGQLSATVASVWGRNAASIAGTLTTAVGPLVKPHSNGQTYRKAAYGLSMSRNVKKAPPIKSNCRKWRSTF